MTANTVLTNVKLGNKVKVDSSAVVKVDPMLVESRVSEVRYAKSQEETTSTMAGTDRFITGRLGLTVAGATVEAYDAKGNLLSRKEKATDASGRYDIGLVEEASQAAYLKVYDGTIGKQPFTGVMEGLCSQTVPQVCQITPYSGLILRLSALYSNADPLARQQAASQLTGEVAGLLEDPFLVQRPDATKVNLPLWQSLIGDGTGLAFMLDSLSSDMVDGYVDEPANYPFLLAIKPRTSVTETVAIDQAKLQQQLSGAHLATPGTLKVVSFANEGESQVDNGQSMVSHENYLSGYAAVAEYPTGEPEEPVSVEILYHAFNLGKWKGQLNAETTTLYEVFLQQPELIFLPPSEQQRIAELLAGKDEFVQAVELYDAELQSSDTADPETRSFLISALARQAVDAVSSMQTRETKSLLQTRVDGSQPQEDLNPSSRTAQLRSIMSTDIVPAPNSEKMFSIFDGMRVQPVLLEANTVKTLYLDFYSNAILWYAVFDSKKFVDDQNASWWSNILDPSLITPKSNLISLDAIFDPASVTHSDNSVRTRMPVANMDCNLRESTDDVDCDEKEDGHQPPDKADLVVFRNNPNSWVDAPQLMNTVMVVDTMMEAVSGLGVLKHVQKALGVAAGDARTLYLQGVSKLYALTRHIRPYLQGALEATDILKVICDGGAWGWSSTDCDQRFGQLETFKEVINSLPEPLPGDSTNSALEEIRISWFQLANMAKTLRQNTRAVKQLGGFKAVAKEAVVVFLLDEFVTKPIMEGLPDSSETDIVGNQLVIKKQQLNYTPKGGVTVVLPTEDVAKAMLHQRRNTLDDKDKLILKTVLKEVVLKNTRVRERVELGWLGIHNVFSGVTAFANLLHKYLNLQESLVSLNTDEISKFFALVVLELWRAGQDTFKEASSQLVWKALLSVTPAKVVALVAAGGKVAGMTYDWMTKPNVVRIQIERLDKDGNNSVPVGTMRFNHFVPELEAVRYLVVENEFEKYILDTDGITQTDKNTNQVFYSTGNDPNANHFLVMSGFTASVENHAVVKPEDKEPLNGVHSSVDWHSYRYGSLPKTTLPTLETPPTNRSVDNAFLGKNCDNSGSVNWFEDINYCNYWKEVLSNNWFGNTYNTYQIGDVDSANPMLYLFLKQRQRANNYYLDKDGNLNYLDFTKIYGKGLLTHKTPGVYRDTTVFKVCSAPDKCDEYDNTFNMYVLPNYLEPLLQVGVATANLNSSLKAQSKVDGRMLKLRLYRPCPQASNTYWDTAKFFEDPPCTKMPLSPEMTTKRYRGLKDMPFYVMTKTTIDGRTYWRGPYEKRLGDEEYALVSSPLYWMPHTTRVYVYDAIMEAWQREVGNNIKTVFDEYDRYPTGKVVSANGENKNVQPFMAFNLDELNLALVKVYDSISGNGLEKVGVTVVKGNSPEGESFASGLTNLEGVVEISPQQRPPDGQYTVTVCKDSYACVSKTVTIDANNQPPVEFYLTPEGTIKECNTVVESGGMEAETHIIELAKSAGTLQFDYETYSAKDRIAVEYEGKVLFDSECVGTNGWRSEALSYEGNSTQIKVTVSPACAGDSSTQWDFKVGCPSPPPPLAPDLSLSAVPQ
ncbi:MAG: hypothetical protein BWK78_07660 [Thiotrichaceae bacterium IS1]|nr:MAG: hypothetical protein BWK78_07660 [Thiotrichaceae bacterium IS1]